MEWRNDMTVERVALAYQEVLRIHRAPAPGQGFLARALRRLSGRLVTWRLQQAYAPLIRRAPYALDYAFDSAGGLTVRSPLHPDRTFTPAGFHRAVRGDGVILLFRGTLTAKRVLYFQTPEQGAALAEWLGRGGVTLEDSPRPP